MLKKIIIAVQILFAIWIVGGIAGANCENEQYVSACEAGTGIGVFLVFMLWAIVDIVLLTIFLVTRNKNKA